MLKAKNKFFMFGRSAIIRSGFLFYLLTYRILDHNFQFSIFNFQFSIKICVQQILCNLH